MTLRSESRRPLIGALILGTVLQVAMVLAGHSLPAVAQLFGLLGVTFSFVAGLAYAAWARPEKAAAAWGGALAGAGCALVGIAVSYALGDVTAVILGLGTLSSAVTGLLGGLVGRLLPGGRALSRT